LAPNVRIKNHWSEQRIFAQRTFAAMTVVALLGFVLLGRLVYLQIVKHDYYVELSLGNRVRLEPIPASRGLIRDRHGIILADNAPAYQLELVREQVPDLSGTLRRLTALGLIDPDELEALRVSAFVPVRLGPRVLRTETAAIAALAWLQSRFGDLKIE